MRCFQEDWNLKVKYLLKLHITITIYLGKTYSLIAKTKIIQNFLTLNSGKNYITTHCIHNVHSTGLRTLKFFI